MWGKEEHVVYIRLVRLNICNGRYWEAELAMHVIVQVNMDLGVIFETNITVGVYKRHSLE